MVRARRRTAADPGILGEQGKFIIEPDLAAEDTLTLTHSLRRSFREKRRARVILIAFISSLIAFNIFIRFSLSSLVIKKIFFYCLVI